MNSKMKGACNKYCMIDSETYTWARSKYRINREGGREREKAK